MSTNPVHHDAPNIGVLGLGGWKWRKPDRGQHYRTCSYCGSINPEDLVAEPQWQANWADQKYGWPHKFYVDIPDRLGKPTYLGSTTGPMADEEVARYGWKRVADLSPAELEVAREHLDYFDNKLEAIGIGVKATHHAKFYTEHLSDPRIPDAVKSAIHDRCGIAFEWEDGGHVSWTYHEVRG